MIENIGFTVAFAFLGWLFWTWFEFNLTKNKSNKSGKVLNAKDYKQDKWEEWIGSAILAVILIFIGHAGLGFQFVELINQSGDIELKWTDLWYAGSGPVYELLLFLADKLNRLRE